MSTAQEAVKQVRLLHKIFLATIALYAYVAEMLPHAEAAAEKLTVFRIGFFAVAISNTVLALFFRRKMVEVPGEELMRDPANGELLKRWRGGNLITFVFCETVALFGFAFRFLGAPLREAAVFYVVAAALLILWAPRGEFARGN